MKDTRLSDYDTFAIRFSSCCFEREWFQKTGGCFGISILSSQLNMEAMWLLKHELKVSFFFFLKKKIFPSRLIFSTLIVCQGSSICFEGYLF